MRAGIWVLCLLPLGMLVFAVFTNGLGPDPAEKIMHVTGEWSLRLLLLTLLISPLRQWTRWAPIIGWRRVLGLCTFLYACIHLLCFGHFFLGWTFSILVEELLERPYIAAGFAAWLLMLPLAITSTRAMQRRLRLPYIHIFIFVSPLYWAVFSPALNRSISSFGGVGAGDALFMCC